MMMARLEPARNDSRLHRGKDDQLVFLRNEGRTQDVLGAQEVDDAAERVPRLPRLGGPDEADAKRVVEDQLREQALTSHKHAQLNPNVCVKTAQASTSADGFLQEAQGTYRS